MENEMLLKTVDITGVEGLGCLPFNSEVTQDEDSPAFIVVRALVQQCDVSLKLESWAKGRWFTPVSTTDNILGYICRPTVRINFVTELARLFHDWQKAGAT